VSSVRLERAQTANKGVGSMSATKIAFADLTHVGETGAGSYSFPLGASLILSEAKKIFGDQIETQIFKYPDDFAEYLNANRPRIVGFSNYNWNFKLSCEFAKKIREKWDDTIIIFGGPNYPVSSEESQKKFLENSPFVDFYVAHEGELAAVELFRRLIDHDLDAEALKSTLDAMPNVHYLHEGQLVTGPVMDRIMSLSDTPSPYTSGMMDKFFDGVLVPLMQTNRGCPFGCSFCQEGTKYYNKIRWSEADRISSDLRYIAEKSTADKKMTSPDLILADSNFGMYKQDLETCHDIAALQDKFGWGENIQVSSGKNQKERVIEAATILRGAINLSASVQSVDEVVLANIKRSNISTEAFVEYGAHAKKMGAVSYSEIILALPGDSFEAHSKSIYSMIDAGMNYLRIYQMMLLSGSEISSDPERVLHEYISRWRVMPRCFGNYRLWGEEFFVAEVEEICVGNITLPYEDYLRCRDLDLIVEIFYNDDVFLEFLNLLRHHGVSASIFIERIHQSIFVEDGPLTSIWSQFREDQENVLWQNRDALVEFLKSEDSQRGYIDGSLGGNDLYKARVVAFFENLESLHDLVHIVTAELLEDVGEFDDGMENYLQELRGFSLLRKNGVLEVEKEMEHTFHFDFPKLMDDDFKTDPSDYRLEAGVTLKFFHTGVQADVISRYIASHGSSITGLTRLLLRGRVQRLYRTVEYADHAAAGEKIDWQPDRQSRGLSLHKLET
jgi:radical SAM superfamily enzyme YgiQ (UPF0313 family)